MKIKRDIWEKLIYFPPIVPPEIGGVLGGRDGIISKIYFDCENVINGKAIYVPDVKQLNCILEGWNREEMKFIGLFHSHMHEQETLSGMDREYIERIVKALAGRGDALYFPIIIPREKIIVYKAFQKNEDVVIQKENIEIV